MAKGRSVGVVGSPKHERLDYRLCPVTWFCGLCRFLLCLINKFANKFTSLTWQAALRQDSGNRRCHRPDLTETGAYASTLPAIVLVFHGFLLGLGASNVSNLGAPAPWRLAAYFKDSRVAPARSQAFCHVLLRPERALTRAAHQPDLSVLRTGVRGGFRVWSTWNMPRWTASFCPLKQIGV